KPEDRSAVPRQAPDELGDPRRLDRTRGDGCKCDDSAARDRNVRRTDPEPELVLPGVLPEELVKRGIAGLEPAAIIERRELPDLNARHGRASGARPSAPGGPRRGERPRSSSRSSARAERGACSPRAARALPDRRAPGPWAWDRYEPCLAL